MVSRVAAVLLVGALLALVSACASIAAPTVPVPSPSVGSPATASASQRNQAVVYLRAIAKAAVIPRHDVTRLHRMSRRFRLDDKATWPPLIRAVRTVVADCRRSWSSLRAIAPPAAFAGAHQAIVRCCRAEVLGNQKIVDAMARKGTADALAAAAQQNVPKMDAAEAQAREMLSAVCKHFGVSRPKGLFGDYSAL